VSGDTLQSRDAGIDALRHTVQGELFTAADDRPRYDEARKLFNGGIDRRPLLIARCQSEDDVKSVLGWAVSRALPVAVRAGGHGVHGRAICDGGVVIDLRSINDVTVDAAARTARVGGGALWSDVYPAVAAHGLGAVGGTVGTVGVAGLVMGGGFGWLTRRYGYASDNVESFEVLTADGSVRRVNKDEHDDLFWALRGAGGIGLGIILATTLRLHPVPERLVAGKVMYDASDAALVLDRYAAFMRDADRDTNAVWARMALPDVPDLPGALRGRTIVMVALCHFGSDEAAHAALAPMRNIATPLFDDVSEMSYAEMQQIMEEGIPTGVLNFWTGVFLSDLPYDGAAAMLDAAEAAPAVPIQLWQMGPAVGARDEYESSVGRAGRAYYIGSPTMWLDPEQSKAMRAATLSVAATVAPWRVAACPNHSGPLRPSELIETFGSQKLARLRETRKRYDAEGVFTGGLEALGDSSLQVP
jgi:FAD binding domain